MDRNCHTLKIFKHQLRGPQNGQTKVFFNRVFQSFIASFSEPRPFLKSFD